MWPSRLLLASGSFLVVASSALAQVAGGGPVVKWSQPPDLSSTGIDVNGTYPGILADDFLCRGSGPIADVHIWGSWLNDVLPIDSAGAPDAGAVSFKLSIHSDILKGPDHAFSVPGPELWSEVFAPGNFVVSPPVQTTETFMNPPSTILGNDTQAYEYSFFPIRPFIQQRGNVYWLDVQALPDVLPGTAAIWGWKTSTQHWNDDAVFGSTDVASGFPGTTNLWTDLIYPDTHPFVGQSIDLAFDLTTVPEPSALLSLLPATLMIRRRRA